MGEAYRVEEHCLGGADGGIDLILYKDGRITLVQCKQWRARQVSVSTVREMWGLLAHHHADAVNIVCAGAFAEGKSIELVSGQALVSLIQSVQTPRRRSKRE